METFFTVVLVILFGVIGCVLLGLLFFSIDSAFIPTQHGTAIIIEKEFTEAHTTTTMMLVGKVMIPQTMYHDDEYTLHVRRNNEEDSIDVEKSFYDAKNIGQEVPITYGRGRISGKFYVKSI